MRAAFWAFAILWPTSGSQLDVDNCPASDAGDVCDLEGLSLMQTLLRKSRLADPDDEDYHETTAAPPRDPALDRLDHEDSVEPSDGAPIIGSPDTDSDVWSTPAPADGAPSIGTPDNDSDVGSTPVPVDPIDRSTGTLALESPHLPVALSDVGHQAKPTPVPPLPGVCVPECEYGVCHDGKCFCKYPYTGHACTVYESVRIAEWIAFFIFAIASAATALLVLVFYSPGSQLDGLPRQEDAHMADEEWKPPKSPRASHAQSPRGHHRGGRITSAPRSGQAAPSQVVMPASGRLPPPPALSPSRGQARVGL